MNPFTSLATPIEREEEMDAIELPPARYAKVLRDLSRINALTLARRPTVGFLERVRARGVGTKPWRILDVGFGAGDMLARVAHWGDARGVPLDLTPVEFRLLRMLAATPGRVLGRQRLLDGLYEDHRVVTDRTVDSHVKNLRRKLAEAAPGRDLIRSVYGVGFALDPAASN